MPDENRCWFAETVVDVRREYGLTTDRREADALERVLSGPLEHGYLVLVQAPHGTGTGSPSGARVRPVFRHVTGHPIIPTCGPLKTPHLDN